ncbi:MAG: hypothetical protein QM759_06745 [Terricaulis sp.]
MLRMMVAASALAMMAALPAGADDLSPGALNDVRCLVVADRLGGPENTPEIQHAGALLAFFYFGRLQGEAPGVDLEPHVFHEGHGMTQATFDTERVRCGTEFGQVSQSMGDLGRRLQADSHASTQPQ